MDQIIEHATQLIAEKGYFGFSLGELAQRCGLSNAGLIHHIGSKERVLEMVLQARDRRDLEAIGVGPTAEDLSVETARGSGRDAMREALLQYAADGGVAVLHRLVAHNATQPTMVRLYAILRAESLSEEHPSHEYFQKRDAQSVDLFEQLLTGHVADPRGTARAAFALMGGLEEQWLREPDQVDLVAAWDQAYASLLDGARN
ncbi:TetR/AcrR family transcriptional regulator [Actinomyces procaprae]|uniref:TetR/AcrR family transcriptional regulator n=1 Tax=Actinomyces procaprae TaxID=2560010 RepID=UPI0014469C37|nr:helix-turn-helix domain-containing protein [Actinomyces procaprae]